MNTFITVIIPTFKPQNYIYQCLESLCNQTLPKHHFEVIVILNGDKSPYYEKLASFFEQNNTTHWVFLYTPILGVSNARNIGLNHAKGEYITFIDDDDFISPSYLEQLLSNSTPKTIALCHPICFEDSTNKIMPYDKEVSYFQNRDKGILPFYKMRKFFSGPCMKLIHHDIIQNYKFDTRFKNGEDSLFMFLISKNFKWVSFTSEDAIYYRRLRSNSAWMGKKSLYQKIDNAFLMFSTYNKYFFTSPFQYSFHFYCTRIMGLIKSILFS